MRYLIILVGMMLLLGAVSCDRFDHDFTSPNGSDTVQILIDLEQAFTQVSADDLSPLAEVYAESYLHNGVNKADRIAWFGSFYSQAEDITFVLQNEVGTNIDNTSAVINWRLLVLGGETVLADSVFFGERASFDGNRWQLQGNGVCTGATPKQLVIAEYFTFDTCPNCPVAEAKLHQLQAQYPNFIYLEHHIANSLLVPGNDTSAYYSAYSAPTAVFQGQNKVIGSNAAALANYESIVDNLANIDFPISYELSNINHNAQQVSATVRLSPNISIDMTDVFLNYVVITDEVTQTNINGDPLHNVVRAVGRTALAGQDLGQGIPISLQMPNGLPSNYKLVVFAQYRPQSFANNSTIYGGIVHAVSAR